MYTTVWLINDGEFKIEFTYYHFGKEPKFPTWYMEEGKVYEIEMIWNWKLVPCLQMFVKCLFHEYVIR